MTGPVDGTSASSVSERVRVSVCRKPGTVGEVIARFPDGRCLQYGTSMRQEYVGGDFASAMTTNGTGGGVPLPCEAVDAIAAARSSRASRLIAWHRRPSSGLRNRKPTAVDAAFFSQCA